ncbi:MAG: hypothetical protein FD168_566 [Desulfobulbaceae bacterium]|nr:MAG: hypothetical protein FD168_566 [Desulfobulbaceae bacterium]
MRKTAKNLLSALDVSRAKKQEKAYKLSDGSGLFLVVEPSGKRWWKYRAIFAGKETSFSFGEFPDVTLAQARAERDTVSSAKANGINPAAMRKAEKATSGGENCFEAIAREWHKKWADAEWSQSHAKNIMVRLEKHVFPWVKARPINQILPMEMLEVFRRIESTGHLETLHRTIANCSQVFRHAIFTGRATVDPCHKMGEAFPDPIKKHFAAITEPVAVGALLRAIEDYHGGFVVRCALMLAPLLMLRPGELRLMEWAEVDYDKAVLTIPIGRMKRTRRDKEAFSKEVHVVPLSRQAIEVLQELYPLTGSGKLVFSGMRGVDRAISDATLTNGLRRMGYDSETMHVHGFRAMARTMVKERLKIDADIIERQLSHAIDNPLGKAYDRTTMMPERVLMMQGWADYLDKLKAGAEIIPIRAAV